MPKFEKFDLRQGLWIEDLRIPPGQECSNGSLILLAVVLWRTFSGSVRLSLPAVPGAPVTVEFMKLLKTKTIRFSQIVRNAVNRVFTPFGKDPQPIGICRRS